MLFKLFLQTMLGLSQHVLADGSKHGNGVGEALLIGKLLGVRVRPVHRQGLRVPVERGRAQVVDTPVLEVWIPHRVAQALGANHLPTHSQSAKLKMTQALGANHLPTHSQSAKLGDTGPWRKSPADT